MTKELEALNRITEHLDLDDDYFYKQEKYDEEIIKTALKDSEYNFKLAETLGEENEKLLLEQMNNCKKLKALEIIKEKVNRQALLHLFAVEVKDQAEFDLLKEVLL